MTPKPLGQPDAALVTKCPRVITDINGAMDNFAAPPDPRTLSPALQAFLAGPGMSPADYDVDEPNHHIGASFRVCPCEVCAVRVEIRVRPTSNFDIANNDGYAIGVAPFGPGRVLASGSIGWVSGQPNAPKTIVVNISGADATRLLCERRAEWLDVYVQDDTVVDWVRVTIRQP